MQALGVWACLCDLFLRYPPHGRRAAAVENGVTWDRLRAPPIDTSPHDLHISDCLTELRPEDHIEIQWRRNKEFPYGLFFILYSSIHFKFLRPLFILQVFHECWLEAGSMFLKFFFWFFNPFFFLIYSIWIGRFVAWLVQDRCCVKLGGKIAVIS